VWGPRAWELGLPLPAAVGCVEQQYVPQQHGRLLFPLAFPAGDKHLHSLFILQVSTALLSDGAAGKQIKGNSIVISLCF